MTIPTGCFGEGDRVLCTLQNDGTYLFTVEEHFYGEYACQFYEYSQTSGIPCPDGSGDAVCCDGDGSCLDGDDDYCCSGSFYCSNDGASYAQSMGGILCPATTTTEDVTTTTEGV